MTLQDIIEFHAKGADACEAYAITPDADSAKNKDIAKHYKKHAQWHRDAIALVQGLSNQGEPSPVAVIADLDAALAREAALREELKAALLSRDYCKRVALHNKEVGDDLQQRLTVAEQLLKRFDIMFSGGICSGPLQDLAVDVRAALKTAAEGLSHDQ